MEKKNILSGIEQRIVLHIPHSSTTFPEYCGYHFYELDKDERLLIDFYTDELFAPPSKSKQICSMVFPYCRLYSDVERLINDPLEKEGLGISYHRQNGKSSSGERSFSTLESAFSLYADFHAMVSKKIVETGEGCLLIDCHSFSHLPNLLNSNPPDIDICIGYNDDETCPDRTIIDTIAHHFSSCGYIVGINTPFSNSKTFAVPVKYHSIMIEVNKRLYMNEDTLAHTNGFQNLKFNIQSLYELLLKK